MKISNEDSMAGGLERREAITGNRTPGRGGQESTHYRMNLSPKHSVCGVLVREAEGRQVTTGTGTI